MTGQDMADFAFGLAEKIHSVGQGVMPDRICAWCKCGLGPDPRAEKARAASGAPISHGICPECARKLEADPKAVRWRKCEECDGEGYFLSYVGEENNAGMGPTRIPVEKWVRCEATDCESGYVAVEPGDEDYTVALVEHPNEL